MEIPEITGNNQEIRDDKGRFIKGVSGNPAGKPVGKKSYETEMNEAIEEYAKLNNMTPEQVKVRIYMKGAGEALKGEYSFFRDYMDRVHGKPKEEHNIFGEINITISKEIGDKYETNP